MYVVGVITLLLLINNVFCEKLNITEYLPQKWDTAYKDIKVNPDAGLNIYQFLKKFNYPFETHWVTTEDGYVLRMHRIVGGQNKTSFKTYNKPAVLLMHGLSSSSMSWVQMGPKKALALALADAGYDVWLGNTRGNTYSRNHVSMDPDIDEEFWDFSFEQCGYYDLPAKIDYILEKSGQQKLFYVGYSQGTSQFFAMATLRPEYNDKIALMSAFAPVAYMEHLSSPLLRLLANNLDVDILKNISKKMHWHEFSKFNPLSARISEFLCADGSPVQEFCAMSVFILGGFDSQGLNRSFLSVYESNSPAGLSINMIIHYGQEIQSGYFRRYDYGKELNRVHYNSDTPPNFNISAISAPVALYYGQNDFLAAVKDVERLASELPNLVKKRLIEYKRWTHMDFVIYKDVYEILNLDLLAHQQQFIDNGALTTTSTTEKPNSSGNRNFIQNNYVCTIIVFVLYIIHF